jgi:hypothetical protein
VVRVNTGNSMQVVVTLVAVHVTTIATVSVSDVFKDRSPDREAFTVDLLDRQHG